MVPIGYVFEILGSQLVNGGYGNSETCGIIIRNGSLEVALVGYICCWFQLELCFLVGCHDVTSIPMLPITKDNLLLLP